MTDRFRIELEQAPWVYDTATSADAAQERAAKMLTTYEDLAVYVYDLHDDSVRMFKRDGKYMLEAVGVLA